MVDYDRVKHLEMISKAIERMDKSASSMKALSPAALGVALVLIDHKVPAWLALAAAAIAVITYWFLDAQYLGRERAFRGLFDKVRKGELDSDPYFMNIGKLYGDQSVRNCMKVGAVIGIHGSVLLLIIVAFFALSILPRS